MFVSVTLRLRVLVLILPHPMFVSVDLLNPPRFFLFFLPYCTRSISVLFAGDACHIKFATKHSFQQKQLKHHSLPLTEAADQVQTRQDSRWASEHNQQAVVADTQRATLVVAAADTCPDPQHHQ